MNNFTFESRDGELNLEDKQLMTEGMLAYHASKGHSRKVNHFCVVAKDLQDKTLGTVVVSFLWNGMEIDSLWVDEFCRGKGLGRKLMEIVEREAIKRGCTFAYTNTFSWQAPGFYQKLGYSLYGKLDDFPQNCSLSYFRKLLK